MPRFAANLSMMFTEVPFLERLEGPGLALDLPGWGFSEKPKEFDYSMHGLARFFERFLDRLEELEPE